jgi:hypothetical protein
VPDLPHNGSSGTRWKRQRRKTLSEAIAEAKQASESAQRSPDLDDLATLEYSVDSTPAPGEHASAAPPVDAARTTPAPASPSAPSSSALSVPRSSENVHRERAERSALTQNPRKLHYHRTNCAKASTQLHMANRAARSDRVSRLTVPRQVHDFCHDVCDDSNALAGALDWIRRNHGAGVALDVENCGLFRERGGVQRDDWSRARARRKVALLTFLLMAPYVLARRVVTGSSSDEPMLVTAGVPQTLLVLLTRSSQREPYSIRTLQRDLAEIDLCSDILVRWRTPVAHAEAWECNGKQHGVVNRYCVRAGMIRDQWRRACNAGEAIAKRMSLSFASWMVWRPATARGSRVMPIGPPVPST